MRTLILMGFLVGAVAQASSPLLAKPPAPASSAVPALPAPPQGGLRVEDLAGQAPAAGQGAQGGAGMPGLSPEQATQLQKQLEQLKKSREEQKKALEQIEKDL